MPRESDVTKLSRAHDTVRGLRKLLGPADAIRIDGVPHSRDEIIAAFDRHEKAVALKRKRWAAYRDAVAQERELARLANWFWVGLRRWANAVRSNEDVAALGMRAYRKTGPKKTQAKLAGVQKRAKKRAPK